MVAPAPLEVFAFVEQFGIAVFPCREADKKPLTKHGFKDASREPDVIGRWAQQHPGCLWGAPTGRVSGLFVVDVDIKPHLGKHGDEALAKLCGRFAALPATAEVLTPSGGRHLYFSHPADIETKSVSDLEGETIGAGLDIRADGGYVIVPPSRVNGHAYEWEAASDPADGGGFAIPPAWLVELVRKTPAQPPPREAPSGKSTVLRTLESIRRGSPLHDSVRDLAASLAEHGVRFDDGCALLSAVLESSLAPRDARFEERRAEIPALMRSGLEKYGRHESAPRELEPGESAATLLERAMPMIQYLADPWIPEGLDIIAGRPKLGKSTLLRQRQAAIAAGGELWGATCEAADCVYLSLEEGDRLTRAKFAAANFPRAALARIEIFYQWPRGADGVLQLLRLLDARPQVRHVGIDSLSRFRQIPDARTPQFQADYEAVNALHEIVKSRPGLAIDVIHHTRKIRSDDPLDDISGTYGLSAGCDSYAILRHAEAGALLFIGGRLWCRDDNQYELKRTNQRWELVGAFTGLTDIQKTTLDTLRASGGQGPTDCAKYWGIGKTTAQDRLEGLVRRGVAYSKDGIYHAKL